jgi:putative transposase
MPKLLRSLPGVEIETIGFDEDHLHMMMLIPPKYSISDVMGKLKSQSSHHMRKTFSWLSKVYWKENIVWSPGYFVSSVGVNEQVIANYVKYPVHARGYLRESRVRENLMHGIEEGSLDKGCAEASDLLYLNSNLMCIARNF